MEKITQGAPK